MADGPHQFLLLAPTGKDASLIASVLAREEMSWQIFDNMEALCRRLEKDAGSLLIAEEAFYGDALVRLNHVLRGQPAWSDIPLIILTGSGRPTSPLLHLLESFEKSGNVTLLERPLRQITLISTLKVALRSRARQYQVRELLKIQLQATQIRDEFISIASHELKTPLTALKLQAEMNARLMKSRNPSAFAPARMVKLVETTTNQVNRLTRLVEDMLDASRIGSGKLAMQVTVFDLSELARELIERFMPQLTAVGCRVEEEIEESIVGNWDRYRIEQVINNLVTNAIRYAPGSKIRICLKRVGSVALIQVQDEGMGIAEENQSRIFDRFERAVHSNNISGLGLGLYICKQIVDSHSGAIRVESELGKGSTFTVELPLSGIGDTRDTPSQLTIDHPPTKHSQIETGTQNQSIQGD